MGWQEGTSQDWFRGLDSNQDSRLQRPMCYQLHHPGMVWRTLLVYLRVSDAQNLVSLGILISFWLRVQKSARHRHAGGMDFC